MKNFERDEIVAVIEAYGESLQGDAMAISTVLEEIARRCIRDIPESEETPDYSGYEESAWGRQGAESEAAGNAAWRWFRSELLALAKTASSTPELFI